VSFNTGYIVSCVFAAEDWRSLNQLGIDEAWSGRPLLVQRRRGHRVRGQRVPGAGGLQQAGQERMPDDLPLQGRPLQDDATQGTGTYDAFLACQQCSVAAPAAAFSKYLAPTVAPAPACFNSLTQPFPRLTFRISMFIKDIS
jgi:hypothetical protein